MSKAKEEFYEYFNKHFACGEYILGEFEFVLKYIKELEKQNEEMLELILYLQSHFNGLIKTKIKLNLEKITGKPIEEVLRDE